MNPMQKELLASINGTERFAGMDGYDSAEGDFMSSDDFGGMGMNANNYLYASGGAAQAPMSLPYVLQYVNGLTSSVTATLFGYNLYGGAGITNFGNNASVAITNLQGASQTYQSLLLQSATNPFRIAKWRFTSSASGQLSVTFSLYSVNANGVQTIIPMNLSILIDAYQQQSNFIDVVQDWIVDGNSYATFTLVASATLTIAMFPTTINSAKHQISSGQAQSAFRAPRLSGGNVAPVIIQTSQGVQGVQGR